MTPRAFPLTLRQILLWSLAMRLVFALIVPMTDDETYAISVARTFSISFFDHPPIGFWLPAAAEALLGPWPEIIYRLPALILGTGVIWLFYLIGRDLGGDDPGHPDAAHRVGLWAAGLAAVTPTVVIYGVAMLPDTPLNFFVLATVLILLRLARQPRAPLALWAAGGAMLALAMASKYQAGLVPLAVLLWAAVTPAGRVWFRRPGFYLAVAIALLGLLPVLIWNAGHDWASFRFQSARPGSAFSPSHFLHMAAVQALYLLPLLVAWALYQIGRRDNWADPVRRLLVMIALGPIVMFNLIYLRDGLTLAHWPMVGWISLIPLVALWLSQRPGGRAWRWHLGMAGAIYLVLAAAALQLSFGAFTRLAATQPDWDRAGALVSMRGLRDAVDQSGYTDGIAVLAADGWVQGGHIAAAMGDTVPMRILGPQGEVHHFAFLPGQTAGGAALLLDIADRQTAASRTAELLALARQYDPAATVLPAIPLARAGQDQFRILAIALTLCAAACPASPGGPGNQ